MPRNLSTLERDIRAGLLATAFSGHCPVYALFGVGEGQTTA